jgi:hypothetical protein
MILIELRTEKEGHESELKRDDSFILDMSAYCA